MSEIARLRGEVERWTERELRPFIEELRGSKPRTKGKEINDPVCGTISLYPAEVALIDSPLMQRLRRVRQLGVAHWVYPGAGHSRFEHTLGVLHHTQKLADAINRSISAIKYNSASITSPWERLLRMAALLHDCGHMAFSHVTEKALQADRSYYALKEELCQHFKTEKSQLSEFISCMIIESPAFAALLQVLDDKCELGINLAQQPEDKIPDIQRKLTRTILGQMVNPAIPLLQELISGPFDADKLDYLARDAMYAGVPVAIDISRLIQKIAVAAVRTSELPTELASKLDADQHECLMIGVKDSGRGTLDELHLARALLFAKIYRHQKTLALEAIVAAAVDVLRGLLGNISTIKLLMAISDDELLFLSTLPPDRIALTINEALENDALRIPDHEQQLKTIASILSDLRLRNVPHRAFVLNQNYAEYYKSRPSQSEIFSDLYVEWKNPEVARAEKEELIGVVEKLLAARSASKQLSREELYNRIWITGPQAQSDSSILNRAFLIQEGSHAVRSRDIAGLNVHAWSQAYTLDASAGYIFAPRAIAKEVHLATCLHLASKYGVKVPDFAGDLCRFPRRELAELADDLAQSPFYSKAPRFSRPTLKSLRTAEAQKQIDRVVKKLEQLSLPQLTPSIGGGNYYAEAPFAERLMCWLNGISNDAVASTALCCLDAMRILKRSDYVGGLNRFLIDNPQFSGGEVSVFGDAKDSSSVVTYFANDLAGVGIKGVRHGKDWMKAPPGTPIIFFDDFIGSGGQAADIVQAWFSDEHESALGEARLPFDPTEREQLKGRDVAFVFAAGWQEGVDRLKDTCSRCGINATVFAAIGEAEIPFAAEVLRKDYAKSDTEISEFQKIMSGLGSKLLRSRNVDTAKAKVRSFGYGNRGMLLGFEYNVPTQVITTIWQEGDVDGIPWSPLLPRRKKV